MSEKRLKVLYIAGAGRSGSTILGDILNEVPGVFHMGEMRHFWQVSVLEQRLCACGQPPPVCPVWGRAIQDALIGVRKVSASDLYRLENDVPRHGRIIALTLRGLTHAYDERYLEATSLLYDSVARTTKSRVLVDSTKLPDHAFTLMHIGAIDLYILHLVRDSRAVYFSWQRKRMRDDIFKGKRREMVRRSTGRVVRMWDGYNLATEVIGRSRNVKYTRVRYEDFTSRPREVIARLLAYLDEPDAENPVAEDGSVELRGSHAVWGNPSRTCRGRIDIYHDDEWMRKIDPLNYLWVTSLTSPMLMRYGYPLAKTT